jgi:hypothetical protein
MPEHRTETNDQQAVARSDSPEFGEFLGTRPDPNTQMVYARAVRQFLSGVELSRLSWIVSNRA